MKKHFLNFIFTFIFSYFVFAAFTGLWLPSGPKDFGRDIEIYLLLASGSFFLAFANLVFVLLSKDERESRVDEFGLEILQTGSLFIQSIHLFKRIIFLPLWFVLLAYGAAELYLFRAFPLVGLLLVIAAQFIWILWRRRLFRFSDSKAVSIPLYTPLRIILRCIDLAGFLMMVSMIGVIREYAFIQAPSLLMGISLFLSLGMLAWNFGGLRGVLRIDLPLLLAPLFLWITVVIAVLNFALDFSDPIQVVKVSYQDCPGINNRLITVGGKEIQGPLPDEQYYGCQIMANWSGVETHTNITLLRHRGGVGVSWLSYEKNRAE